MEWSHFQDSEETFPSSEKKNPGQTQIWIFCIALIEKAHYMTYIQTLCLFLGAPVWTTKSEIELGIMMEKRAYIVGRPIHCSLTVDFTHCDNYINFVP